MKDEDHPTSEAAENDASEADAQPLPPATGSITRAEGKDNAADLPDGAKGRQRNSFPWMETLTAVLAIATIGLLYATFGLWRNAKDTLEQIQADSLKQAAQFESQISVAMQSADAATKSADTLRAAINPSLSVEEMFVEFDEFNKPMVSIVVSNSGLSDAFTVFPRFEYRFIGHAIGDDGTAEILDTKVTHMPIRNEKIVDLYRESQAGTDIPRGQKQTMSFHLSNIEDQEMAFIEKALARKTDKPVTVLDMDFFVRLNYWNASGEQAHTDSAWHVNWFNEFGKTEARRQWIIRDGATDSKDQPE